MECLRSFTFTSTGNITVPAGVNFNAWGVAPQNYWGFDSAGGTSTFDVQGFKNINVHKIEAFGDVTSGLNLAACLVNDWDFQMQIQGQNPQISGIVDPVNAYTISTQPLNPTIILSRYNPSATFISPINSVKKITLNNFRAFGIGLQNVGFLKLIWNVTFVVYYSYEGEE